MNWSKSSIIGEVAVFAAEQNIERIQAATAFGLRAYSAQSLIRLQDQGFREQLNSKAVSNRIHRDDAVSWLNALICDYLEKRPVPSLIHGVDMGSASYQQIYDFLDGVSSTIQPATAGRIVNSRYRNRTYTSISDLEAVVNHHNAIYLNARLLKIQHPMAARAG